MTSKALVALVSMSSTVSLAAAASAAEVVADDFRTTRDLRPLSLSLAITSYGAGSPFVGLQAQYHPTDRLSLGVQASTMGPLASDLSANLRYFFTTATTSGLFLETSAHLLRLGEGFGGAVEVGWEYRSRGGFLFAASLGGALFHVTTIDHYRVTRTEWVGLPILNLRTGYAF